MIPSTQFIDLGYDVAKIQIRNTGDVRLTLYSQATTDEGAYTPACSFSIYGISALTALRDALIHALEVDNESK